MRIVVDDIAASKTGALSVLRDLYNYILENDSENEYLFVLGDKLLEESGNVKILVRDDVKASRKNRLLFDLKTGADYFNSLKPDVLFSLQNTLPRGYRGKQVLYVHQPLPYQTWKKFSFLKAEEREYAVYQQLIGRMIDASVIRADKVIVQTEWMKDAIIKKTGVAADKVVQILPDVVIPDNLVTGSEKEINSNVINNDVIYNRFFYPAGEILYKNHGLILEAAGILLKRGVTDFEISFTLNAGDLPYLDKYPGYEQIKYLGRISREEVIKRYKKEILLFPSYIETFGYPPAEARAVGGRILASDCPFCHEVLEGYEGVEYFDPFKAEELADLMEKAIGGKLFLEETEENTGSLSTGNSWGKVLEVIYDITVCGQ